MAWSLNKFTLRVNANGREPLNSHYFSTHYPSVYAASERIFGSWKGAIESAGLDYKKIRKYRIWTRTGVLQAIKQMKKAGKSISSQAVQNSDKPLYMACSIVSIFGNRIVVFLDILSSAIS